MKNVEVYEDHVLLALMNSYDNPDLKAKAILFLGAHGERGLYVRWSEAFDAWAKSNGYDDWQSFFDDYEESIEFSGNSAFLDEGGEIELLEINGYYRDGVDYL